MQYDVFFELLKESLFFPKKTSTVALSNEEWEEIYVEACNHSIASLMYETVCFNPTLSQELKSKWKASTLLSQIKWLRMIKAQTDFINLLESNGIIPVVLKGVSAAMYYPNPQQRISNDIDVLVKKDDYDKAFNILVDNGYMIDGELSYHRELVKDGVMFELHHTLPKLPDSKIGEYTYSLIQRGVSLAKETKVLNYSVRVLGKAENGIVLLRHILQHMVKGIGLKQIIDWMMYVNTELDDEAWASVEDIFDRCGLLKTAINVTRMCQKHLGLREENISWCKSGDDEVGDALIKYVMAKGNLGIKEQFSEEERGVIVLTRDKGLVNFFKRLQMHGIANWAACQRCSALKPFAWLHTIFRYSKYVAARDSAPRRLIEDIDIGRERNRLFRSIGCFDSKLYDQKEITK